MSGQGLKPTPSQWTLRQQLAEMFHLDLRSLALMRVCLGLLMLFDLIARWGDVNAFYTDFGVLPRDEYVDHFMGKWVHSFHMMGGQEGTIKLLMVLQFGFGVLFTVGYRTRLFHVLSWLFLISLQGRNPYVLQAGDVLFRLLYFWTIFLPMGAYFSVDRALSDSAGAAPPPKRVSNAWTLGLILQICYVYWYGVVMKTGVEWKEGSAVYYALSLDHFATPFAKLLLEYPWAMTALTYMTYWWEILGPLLAIFPILPQYARLLSVVSMIGMHIGFGAGLALGLFPFVSSVGWLGLLPTLAWTHGAERLVKRRERKGLAPVTIAYDAGCAFCRKGVYILRTMLLAPSATIVQAQDDPKLKHVMEHSRSWVVVSPDGSTATGWAAGIVLLRSSAVFFWLAPVAGWVSGLGERFYRLVERNRERLGRWTRFALVERAYKWRAGWISNGVGVFILLMVTLWNNGNIDKPVLRFGETKIAVPQLPDDWKWFNYSLRLDQRWNMFAPRPMRGDGWFVAQGTTASGHIATLFGDEPAWDKPEWIADTYSNQRWRKYLMNLWMRTFKKHRLHYGRYMCRWWDSRHPEDKIQVFHLLYMKEQTIDEGTAPIRCVTLWRHWCTSRGKKLSNKPYQDHCQEINVRAEAQEAAIQACKCQDAEKPERCYRLARKAHREYVKRNADSKVMDQGRRAEIKEALAQYEQCMAGAPPAPPDEPDEPDAPEEEEEGEDG